MRDFAYHRPTTLDAALAVLEATGTARLLAGGQTLIPLLARRGWRASALVDLGAIPGLSGVDAEKGSIRIGALTTHAAVASAANLRASLPALADLVGGIGDPAVRNRGTIGGALASNDPFGDYPAACLGLGAMIETSCRSLAADDFFTGPRSTALARAEIITSVVFPMVRRATYARIGNPASRHALVGVFVAETASGVRVAVTGARRSGVFRWDAAERALTKHFDPLALCGMSLDPDEILGDSNGTPSYRAHLVATLAIRAATAAQSTPTAKSSATGA